jgi:hypothetical protein
LFPLLRGNDLRQRVIFVEFDWRNISVKFASSWVSRSFFAGNPLANIASSHLKMLAASPKAFIIQAVFWALKSASPRKITTTSPLSIVLAAIALLPSVAVLTACTICYGVRFRSKSSDPASRTTSFLARRIGTTTLGCHTALLLVICAITAAQLRTIGGIAAKKGFGRFYKTVSITFFRFCLVMGALLLSLLSRFFSAKLSRNTFAYLSMALRPAFFLFSSNNSTISFTAFNRFSSPFLCDALSLRFRCSS